ncbi:phosphatase [Apiospora phragmitis]|uniref:Phosphatase n=1 Tax=Apiospora phragmitis TaxID=2905665 RepID=A0ABR1VRK1_9PEZI
MGSWTGFLLTYLLGGVTFIPLVLATILLHAYLTLPVRDHAQETQTDDSDSIVQPGDDTTDLKAALKGQKDELKSRPADASDMAAGYFAVCREYVPMGINAKPIERSTPIGSTTVAAPSRSVYQAMYQTIFDRKQTTGPDMNSGASLRPKKAGNVFYVVLRHGHLMLFDDEEQLEVRHVISLAHHDISIYSGGDKTPEGELFIKRNALCLTRKESTAGLSPDTQMSKPFYLFSENCSAKEDFYFSMIKNQEHVFGATSKAPQPQHFDVKDIISLVQRLHASEEHMQTRWLNALLGRIFLSVYKTRDLENLIREKITKKISRVKRPSFLTRISLQDIDTGDAAPYITNPRLRDLTVEGEFVMEADIKYTGCTRLGIAATARIDLGPRFKAREVNLEIAAVLKKLEGHILFKIKPPPSNRIWFSFQTMPKLEMSIEPIVSSRQITYTVILRQIENRIKEVFAETLDYEEIAAALGDVDEVAHIEETGAPSSAAAPEVAPGIEKSHTIPNDHSSSNSFWARRTNKMKPPPTSSQQASASTTALDTKSNQPTAEAPRLMRKGSYSASSPIISTDPTNAETYKPSPASPGGEEAARVMANVAARSTPSSPDQKPVKKFSQASMADKSVADKPEAPSSDSLAADGSFGQTLTPMGRRNTASSIDSAGSSSPAPSVKGSVKSTTGSIGRNFFTRKETSPTPSTNGGGTPERKGTTLAAVSNAAATAKRWGWNALQSRNGQGPDGRKLSDPPAVDLNQPMGRGQPLPPPGTPLPGPERRSSKVAPIPVPKRSPIQPPNVPSRNQSTTSVDQVKTVRRPVPAPPLPRRRRQSEAYLDDEGGTDENVLVVEVPADSQPNSPLMPLQEGYDEHEHGDAAPISAVGPKHAWVEDAADEDNASSGFSRPTSATVTRGLAEPHQIQTERERQARTPPDLPQRRTARTPPDLPQRRVAPDTEDEEEAWANWLENPDFREVDIEEEDEPAEEVSDSDKSRRMADTAAAATMALS